MLAEEEEGILWDFLFYTICVIFHLYNMHYFHSLHLILEKKLLCHLLSWEIMLKFGIIIKCSRNIKQNMNARTKERKDTNCIQFGKYSPPHQFILDFG
jgi:hypothetical protein